MENLTTDQIAERIARRRRQLLIHSIIYYRFDDNLITDAQWTHWAIELENLQADYPDIAEKCPYAKEFVGFDHSTGYNLPLGDIWANRKARQLLAWRDRHI